ncbi:hypothetical protein PR048_003275 [Dryococelus australis]|uniref:Phosphatidylinositol N-acetylglucosaminyltransferase subunit Q n=1 Tax=Dryococelus australis TaxID=614101 RepID=A0ABQ9IMI9_9NEOP|nr:hypothetical protein PR048_003275 [Dryococelus australis]
MNTVLIFLPSNIQDCSPGYLVGKIEQYPVDKANVFFVCGKRSECDVYKEVTDSKVNVIGYCFKSGSNETETFFHGKENWVVVWADEDKPIIKEVKSGTNTLHSVKHKLVCVLYDVHSVIHAELLLDNAHYQLRYDYFKTLADNVRTMSFVEHKKVTLKIGNFLLARTVDISSGIFILYWLMPVLTSSSLTHYLLSAANDVVTALQELPIWLMGVPAGFKLNHAFNTMLGKFFLYHINLWWTFLVMAKPLLELAFQIFLCFGQLGITFQVSILADLLALVSFHVYCIYVYAARLYYLQLYGLVALFRLFLGKKRNPLRDRIDSCHYSTDQLFMGTLAFTILLFLLPTTLMYYVVFAALRVAIVGLGGFLSRIRYLIEVLPLYVTILWLFRSAKVGSNIFWKVKPKVKGEPLTMWVQVVPGSWWETVVQCVPDSAQPPPPVDWFKLLQDLLVGRLIYPV